MVGLVCASENVSDTPLSKNISGNNEGILDDTILEKTNVSSSNSYDILSYSGKEDVLNANNTINDWLIHKSNIVKCSPLTKQYTTGNIIFPVKAYDIVEYDGVNYTQPKYNSIIKLKVHTGSQFKNYIASVGCDGVALVKVPNLSLGYHKVEIYVAGQYMCSSFIRVIQSNTKIHAPLQTVIYGANNYYKVSVADSNNVFVKNIPLKINIFTGKKYKTYIVKTNSKGI